MKIFTLVPVINFFQLVCVMLSAHSVTTILSAQNTFPYPSNGNVGLGTTSPRQQLEVNGGIAITGVRPNNWSASALYMGDDLDWYRYTLAVRGTLDSSRARLSLFYHSTATNTYWEAFTVEPESLGSQNFDVTLNRGSLLLRNSGNVHLTKQLIIGADPSFTGFAPLSVTPNNDSNQPTIVFPDRANSRYSVGIGSRHIGGEGQAMDFYAGDSGANGTNVSVSARRMTLTASGNLGIGTANPAEKLSVNGKVRAKEVIVEASGWADHILDKGYRLSPLAEVEAHIAKNGTLPGIPSSREVADQGISIGEMQAKLLGKVEEITLHLIALQKENAQLKAKVEQLEAVR
ncbi:MAG: hypothetical protein SFV32_13890 [Opitutaceae bacterium]|nr:hypothetical protein [Opitutaceae bacterium]